MMELINKRHDRITSNQRVELADYVRVDEKVMYFSAGCNVNLGIIEGLYMHFINDGDRWLFFLNCDTDGFVTKGKKGKLAVMVFDSSLCHLFRKRTLCSVNAKFLIQKTKMEMKGNPVYEIMINKIIE